jgi:putative transposase
LDAYDLRMMSPPSNDGRKHLVIHCALFGGAFDNAACEGFFGLLKRERTRHQKYRTRAEITADVFHYIEQFHNPRMQRKIAGAK